MTEPTFGIKFTRVDNQPRPAHYADMSVVGLIGIAPNADAATYPFNAPVKLYSNDPIMLNLLGDCDMANSIRLINANLAPNQGGVAVIVVRVEEGANEAATLANIAGDTVRTGLCAFKYSVSAHGITPRLLCVPTYGGNPVVQAALPQILNIIQGAVCFVSTPTNSNSAAIQARSNLALHGGIVPIGVGVVALNGAGDSVSMDASAVAVGVQARLDFMNGGVPSRPCTNVPAYGIIGLNRPMSFNVMDGACEGQDLLAHEIGIIVKGESGNEAAIADGGYSIICCDNVGSDDIFRQYHQYRMRGFINLMLLRLAKAHLGGLLTLRAVQIVMDEANNALHDLKTAGNILGYAPVNFTSDGNSPEMLRMGQFTYNYAAEEYAIIKKIGIKYDRHRPSVVSLLSDLMSLSGTIGATV